jgi:predicted nucleic acid-binding protein
MSEPSITLDTGALIALERGVKRMRIVMDRAEHRSVRVTVPSVVLTEWWRADTKRRHDILASVDVESVTERLAKLAGEAIAAVEGATTVDAIVMASAAQRGDVVYTSDFSDLERLHRYFTSVHKVLRVSADDGPPFRA